MGKHSSSMNARMSGLGSMSQVSRLPLKCLLNLHSPLLGYQESLLLGGAKKGNILLKQKRERTLEAEIEEFVAARQ
jgi:hypothetical protein